MSREDILKLIDKIIHRDIHFGNKMNIKESSNTYHDLRFRHQDIHVLQRELESSISHNCKINFKFPKDLFLFDQSLTIGSIITTIINQIK